MPDGSLWTGYYSDWERMSHADKQTVMDTRKKTRQKGQLQPKERLAMSRPNLPKLKKSIAAIKLTNASKEEDTSATDDCVPDNTGNSCGGRNKKVARKD
jgi:hypothetical protein